MIAELSTASTRLRRCFHYQEVGRSGLAPGWTHILNTSGQHSYAHDIPRTLHLIHRKRAFDVLRPGPVGVDSVVRTWIRRSPKRRFGAGKVGKPDRDPTSPSAIGHRDLQGLGDPTERRQPGSGGEQSTARYRTPGQAGPEPAGNDGRLDGTSRRRTRLRSGAT